VKARYSLGLITTRCRIVQHATCLYSFYEVDGPIREKGIGLKMNLGLNSLTHVE
jgi:hypothetical protein